MRPRRAREVLDFQDALGTKALMPSKKSASPVKQKTAESGVSISCLAWSRRRDRRASWSFRQGPKVFGRWFQLVGQLWSTQRREVLRGVGMPRVSDFGAWSRSFGLRFDMSTYCCTQFVVARHRLDGVPDAFWRSSAPPISSPPDTRGQLV